MGVRENIIKLRELTGITQQQLASIADVSRSAVSLWEIGDSEPRMGAVQLMADHFGIRKYNIIEDDGMSNMRVSPNGRLYEITSMDEMSMDESELLRLYRSADKRGKDTIIAVARMQTGM